MVTFKESENMLNKFIYSKSLLYDQQQLLTLTDSLEMRPAFKAIGKFIFAKILFTLSGLMFTLSRFMFPERIDN